MQMYQGEFTLSHNVDEPDEDIIYPLESREQFYQTLAKLSETIKNNGIYKITDSFYCNYIFIILPDSSTTFIAGPYIDTDLSQKMIMEIQINLIIF